MNRFSLALTILILSISLSACVGGDTSANTTDMRASISTGGIDARSSEQHAQDTTVASPDEPDTIDDGTDVIRSLEKEFMGSDFYIKEHMIPLTVTKDRKFFIAYKAADDKMKEENERILVGMPRQGIDLYKVDLSGGKSFHIGKTEFIISYAWSEDGKRLSLVSHSSVRILDMDSGKLSDIPMHYEKDKVYNTSWSPDNRTLAIHLDTVANYYVYDSVSKKIKKTRGGFAEGDVVYRGTAVGKTLISKGETVGVAGGLYLEDAQGGLLSSEDTIIHDINGSKILISYRTSGGDMRYLLKEYDTATGESRILDTENETNSLWKIYKASYLKESGEIVYTTFELDENGVRYLLVRIGKNGTKSAVQVPSPLYVVSPGGSFLSFAAMDAGNSCLMDTKNFRFSGAKGEIGYGKSEIKEIRDLMYRALAIYSTDTPDTDKIRQVFINSNDPVPQEALNNILMEAERTWKYTRLELGKDITMTVKLKDKGRRASVVLDDLYFRGPHELAKKEGRWYITGFSTWPESKTRNDVYKACSNYIEKQKKIGKIKGKVDLSNAAVEIGEIEIWAMSEPHRAVYPDAYAKEARVKLRITQQDGSGKEYLAAFSRRASGKNWECTSFGNPSPWLFPEEMD